MFNCPLCNQPVDAEDEYRGESAECPHCGKPITVPSAASAPRSEIPCKFCGESILNSARKCKHCGEFLDESLRQQQPVPSAPPASRDDEAEKTLWKGGPATLYFMPAILIGVLLLPFIGIGLLVLIYVFFLKKSYTYTVSNKRVTMRKGIISRKTSEAWIDDIRSIDMTQGIFERLFSLGSIGIGTAGHAGIEVEFTHINNPTKVKDLITSQRAKRK